MLMCLFVSLHAAFPTVMNAIPFEGLCRFNLKQVDSKS